MNRILIITGVFYPEPIVSAGLMKDLATELSKDYQVTVIRPKPSRPMGFEIPEYSYGQFPFEVIETDSYVHPASSLIGRGKESYSLGKWCKKYIKQHHDEICFIYNAPWHMFGRNIVAKVALKYSIPYITPVQDIYPESLLSKFPNFPFLKQIINAILLPSDKYLLSHAARIHTISEKMVDYLSKTRGIDKSHFVAIRNWQDERDFVEYHKKYQKEERHPFTFMFMGNVGALAGLEVAIEAFVKAGLHDARLVIAGSGPARDALQKQVSEYTKYDIQFWDVPFGQVPGTQAKADVMILPVKKGFARSSIPSKLPAYMFSAKPVLASVDRDSDSAKCIIDAEAGWVCEPEDVDALATAMKSCVRTQVDVLKSMGERGFNYAIDEFSRTKNLQKLYDACVSVMEK